MLAGRVDSDCSFLPHCFPMPTGTATRRQYCSAPLPIPHPPVMLRLRRVLPLLRLCKRQVLLPPAMAPTVPLGAP